MDAEAEFEASLRYGLLEYGFLRVKCDACQAGKRTWQTVSARHYSILHLRWWVPAGHRNIPTAISRRANRLLADLFEALESRQEVRSHAGRIAQSRQEALNRS